MRTGTCAHTNASVHYGLQVRTRRGLGGSSAVNVVGVRDARNLPVGEIWQETAVRETITGTPAHGAHTKSREMTCDCVCKMEGVGE